MIVKEDEEMERPIAALSLTAFLWLASSLALAQGLGPAFGPFVPFGDLQALLDGQVLDDAEMFFAERPGAYLLRSASLDHPLLINIRNQQVERVAADKIRRNDNSTVSLVGAAVVAVVGPFQVEESRVAATLDGGRRLLLLPKPHLLGPQTAASMVAHNVSYGYRARLYPPSDKTLAELRRESRQVTVRVYFGSWCSACSRVVPWLIAVDEALAGSRIAFEYYGLPHTMDDPIAGEAGVKAVPTAVVSADGVELGRRTSNGLSIPEDALLEILGGD